MATAAGLVELKTTENLKIEWEREQECMCKRIVLEDVKKWQLSRAVANATDDEDKERAEASGTAAGDDALTLVAGVDISFIKNEEVHACASLVILRLPSLEVVYERCRMVEMSAPYIPGFLGFRETPPLVDLLDEVRLSRPELTPQIVVVDGNGVLHPKGCGLACQLGLAVQLPTFGVAKNLFHVDGVDKIRVKEWVAALKRDGDQDFFYLRGDSGRIWGAGLVNGADVQKPVFISAGHLISLDTAVWVTRLCSRYRVPEPTRQADISSREYLRRHPRDEPQIDGT